MVGKRRLELSEYEQQRLKTIEGNQAKLISLGLEPPTALPTAMPQTSRKRPRVLRPHTAAEPTRRSTRHVRPTSEPNLTALASLPAIKPAGPDSEWVEDIFALESSSAGGECMRRFDIRKHHQHLTVSKGRTMVATTGCAGYGMALSLWKPQQSCWEVKVRALGIGGFACGLAQRGWKGPYKSGGNSEHVVAMYHCSGCLMRQGSVMAHYGPEYGEGDTVGVLLNETGQLLFSLNGKQLDVAAKKLDRAGLVLGVQPYMRGAAEILNEIQDINTFRSVKWIN